MLISRSQAADIARRVRSLQSRGVLLGGQIRCCEALGLSFSPIFFSNFKLDMLGIVCSLLLFEERSSTAASRLECGFHLTETFSENDFHCSNV